MAESLARDTSMLWGGISAHRKIAGSMAEHQDLLNAPASQDAAPRAMGGPGSARPSKVG